METGRRAFVGALGAAAAAGALPMAAAGGPAAGVPSPAEPELAPAGTVIGQSSALEGIEAFAFDAYGTLFDVFSVTALCDELFPGSGDALAQRWRAKQLQYSLLRSLMGRPPRLLAGHRGRARARGPQPGARTDRRAAGRG